MHDSSTMDVERKQLLKKLIVGHFGRPTIRGGDGGVEFGVAGGEPGGAFVVEFGEGTVLEAGGAGRVAGDSSRIADRAYLRLLIADC